MDGRVLLVASNEKSRALLPKALRAESPGLEVHVAALASEALERLAGDAYDVAVACTDAPDELALLIRLKKRRPDVPVVVLSRVAHAGFEAIARSMGAERVVCKTAGLAETARSLSQAVVALRSLRENRALGRRTAELAREMRRLARENRQLVSSALGLVAAGEEDFWTLLVEDDAIQADYLVHLLRRAKLPPFVRTAATVAEAVRVLSGPGPCPALVLSDLQLPGADGMSLLRWIRANERTRRVAFVMLTSRSAEADVEAAFEEGADLYLVKSERMADVVDLVRGIYERYVAERRAP